MLQLLALACAVLLHADARTLSSVPAPAPSTDEASCTLTTELETGPFYLDEQLFRSNISEDQPGIPLLLRIKIADTNCEPIVDAFVDIWHCNATGFYSGFTLEGEDGSTGSAMAFSPSGTPNAAPAGQQAPDYNETGATTGGTSGMPGGVAPSGGLTGMPGVGSGSSSGSPGPPSSQAVASGVSAAAAAAGQTNAVTDDYTWLRGVQQTDEDGIVEFETIVPGWYPIRTAHIHVKVHVPYNMSIVDEEAEFEDSHTAHTAQFFFDPTLYDQIAATYPYTLDTTIPRVTNSEDLVYKADPSALLDITWVGSALEDGLVATITSHIDPSSTPAAGV